MLFKSSRVNNVITKLYYSPTTPLFTKNSCIDDNTKGLVKKYRGGGAFGNVVDKKHMTHPLPSTQK